MTTSFVLMAGIGGKAHGAEDQPGKEIVELGRRLEMLVDDFLIQEMEAVRFELARPQRQEVSFLCDSPWEDEVPGFYTVFQDDGVVRLYYRASIPDRTNEYHVVFALAESRDGGLTFERPDLGLVEFQGSKKNNILFIGEPPFVPPPAFLDQNPDCKPGERYKGFCAHMKKLYAVCSSDGLRWRPMSEEPLAMSGVFDTVNTGFWDTIAGRYRSYTRSWQDPSAGFSPTQDVREGNIRAIQTSTSEDFLHWTRPVQLEFDDDERNTHLYTNAVLPCPGAEHHYLGFPNRYVVGRRSDPDHPHSGANDALFMSSRDGVHWKRFLEAWVRPGPDPLNWTERNNFPTWGIVRTSPTEWSMYISEHYHHPGVPCRLRRLSIRPHGFVSVRAGYRGGELLTRPLVFSGDQLRLNYSTSAAGSIQLEIQDSEGNPEEGFRLDDMKPLFGDNLDGQPEWKGKGGLSAFAGKPIRLRIRLMDADLFALRFV